MLGVDRAPSAAGDYGAGLLLEVHALALDLGRPSAGSDDSDCLQCGFAAGMSIHDATKCNITWLPFNMSFIARGPLHSAILGGKGLTLASEFGQAY